MPIDSNNPIFGSGNDPSVTLSPGQKYVQATQGSLADYWNNPQKYEAMAKQQQLQQQLAGPQAPVTQNPAQKAQSDAAYQQVLQRLAAPQGQIQDPSGSKSNDTTDIDPDVQDQLDKEQAAKAAALQQLMGNSGPRGL